MWEKREEPDARSRAMFGRRGRNTMQGVERCVEEEGGTRCKEQSDVWGKREEPDARSRAMCGRRGRNTMHGAERCVEEEGGTRCKE